jgi:hypothetical protein
MSKSKRPSFEQRVRQEVGRSRSVLLIVEGAGVLNTLIRWGAPSTAVAFVAYFVAGKETGVRLEGILKAFANQWIYLTVAGLMGGGWIVERRSLRKRIKEIASEKRSLEEIIDPARSSSGMSEQGTVPRR